MCGCLAAMLITLAATLSRSGFVAPCRRRVLRRILARRDRQRGVFDGRRGRRRRSSAAAAWMNVRRTRAAHCRRRVDAGLEPSGAWQSGATRCAIIRDFPVLGTGVGTFADAMFVYQQTDKQVLFNHAHNEYLQLADRRGRRHCC